MNSKIKEFQSVFFLIGGAVTLTLFVIASDDLIFHSKFFLDNSISFQFTGNWEYWIFALSLSLMAIFFYLYYKVVSDIKKFKKLINSSSKHNFVRNLKELDTIATHLGKRYSTELEETKQKWKV